MDDDGEEEEEEEGPGIGVRPKHEKSPNPLNEAKRQRKARQKEEQERAQVQEQVRRAQGEQEEDQVDQEQQEAQQEQVQQGLNESKIQSFGDGSRILTDWTTSGLISDPINQYEDTCGSVVFAHLLQIMYNKDRSKAERRELSARDLAEYIKSRTKKDKFSFRNLNIPINYIRHTGLHRDDKISGPGVKTKGDFDQNQDATKQFVFDTLELTPLGIVVEASKELELVGMGIYPLIRLGNVRREHAMMVVARGITKSEDEFLVVQNSWGTGFGNGGYCRIFLPDDGRYKIFWPR